MSYRAHEDFIAPARGRAEIWRLFVGLVIAGVVYLVISFIISAAGVILIIGSDVFAEFAVWDEAGRLGDDPFTRAATQLQTGRGPIATIVLLATFTGLIAGVATAVIMLHNRGFLTVLGPFSTLWRHGLLAAGITFAALIASGLLPSQIMPEANMPTDVWVRYLPITLVLVLLQSGAEEILFRGYVQQQLAARFRSPWVWMVLPSMLFAAGHYAPSVYGENALLIVAATGMIGIIFADLTARTGSLGAAWGLHFANNTIGIAFVSSVDELGGLALYRLPDEALPADVERWALLQSMLIVFIIWLLIRLALRR